jgi:thioredoxin-like negative regulator of GroEL
MKIFSGGDISAAVQSAEIVLLYFSRPDCGVCDALRPRIEGMLEDYPGVDSWFVDLDAHPEQSGQFTIFTIPAVVLFVQGRETVRYARYLSVDEVESSVARYYDLLQPGENAV